MVLTIVIAVAVMVVLALSVRECVLYRRRRDSYPLRRLTLRLCMAGMLLFLFVSIALGITVFGLSDPLGFDRLWAFFWGFIMLLTLAILALVIADFRTLNEEAHTVVRELWHDMAEIIATHEEQRKDQ